MPPFIGESLNWLGSVNANLLPVDISYTVYFIPYDRKDRNPEPAHILLELQAGWTGEQVAEKIEQDFRTNYPNHSNKPSRPNGENRTLKYDTTGLAIIHVVRGPNDAQGRVIQNVPIEVTRGLVAWLEPINSP